MLGNQQFYFRLGSYRDILHFFPFNMSADVTFSIGFMSPIILSVFSWVVEFFRASISLLARISHRWFKHIFQFFYFQRKISYWELYTKSSIQSNKSQLYCMKNVVVSLYFITLVFFSFTGFMAFLNSSWFDKCKRLSCRCLVPSSRWILHHFQCQTLRHSQFDQFWIWMCSPENNNYFGCVFCDNLTPFRLVWCLLLFLLPTLICFLFSFLTFFDAHSRKNCNWNNSSIAKKENKYFV